MAYKIDLKPAIDARLMDLLDKRTRPSTWLVRSSMATALMGFVASIVAGVASYYDSMAPKPFDAQIAELNKTEASLKTLIAFVNEQRKNLEESERVLTSLKSEQERLKPIVETDRSAVDAVLAAYGDSQKANVWWERIIGFVVGTVSSLLATFLGYLINKWWTKRQFLAGANQSPPPDPQTTA